VEAVFRSEIFRIFSGGFLQTSSAFRQKSAGNHRKKSENFRLEYCFHKNHRNYPETAVSRPDCSTWVNIEKFLKEYSNGNLTSLNNNSNSSSIAPILRPISATATLVPISTSKTNNRSSASKKHKINSCTTVLNKHTSSTSSIDSLQDVISPIATHEHQTDLINQQIPTPILSPRACKNSDLLNRSLVTSATIDPATKLMELFNGKIPPFTNTNGSTGQVIISFKSVTLKDRIQDLPELTWSIGKHTEASSTYRHVRQSLRCSKLP